MNFRIDPRVKMLFPELTVLTHRILGVKVKKRSAELETFKKEIMSEVRDRYDLDSLKSLSTFRAYRDFFWRVKIDPTKIRPAAEALIRRVLGGRSIPHINTLVDAYNLASMKTEVALAAFDADNVKGNLSMRFAERYENFLGIGMEKPRVLHGGEVVISDEEKLVAIYPYRDAEITKMTEKTKNVKLLVCGVPGIEEKILHEASQVTLSYVVRFCGGEAI